MTGDMPTRPSNASSTRICALSTQDTDRRVRYDIEGLRALAVLSVLVNHAFPKALPGGFAGVDIFFVISGYLIGRHLLQDVQAGHLSILRFYGKRARRIFPALALVLISVFGVGWLLLSATEFANLCKHIAAATLFSNNILLYTETGYFDAAALDKPLLHLWSLGIEEQFYLLVPAMLWLGARGSAASVRWVARLGALSLLSTILLSEIDSAASFYLLHSRFWELAAGVVLAQCELQMNARALQGPIRSARERYVREILAFSLAMVFSVVLLLGAGDRPRWGLDAILSVGGLALLMLITVAVVFLASRYAQQDAWNQLLSRWQPRGKQLAAASAGVGIALVGVSLFSLDSSRWPGAQALFPVLGAVLLIAAGQECAINRLLAARPLALIGGISYPLYLWHWPAIVFFRMQGFEPRGMGMIIPLAVSFALAWLTKALLEDPVRFGRMGSAAFRRPHLGYVAAGLVFTGILGAYVAAANGLPSRFSPRLRAIAAWTEIPPQTQWRVGRCYLYSNETTEFSGECAPAKRPGVPLILLWGDSHAAHLYPGMASLQATVTFDVAQWTSAGCPPTLRPLAKEMTTCPQWRAAALTGLAQLEPDTVVLAGAWERYMDWEDSPDGIIDALAETIHRIKSRGIKRIVVFGPEHIWNTSLAVDLFRFMAGKGSNEIPERMGNVPDEIWRLDEAMAALTAAEDIQYVSILKHFCDKTGCLIVADRTTSRPDLLYHDRDHLTLSGSAALIAYSRPQLLGVAPVISPSH